MWIYALRPAMIRGSQNSADCSVTSALLKAPGSPEAEGEAVTRGILGPDRRSLELWNVVEGATAANAPRFSRA